MEIDIKIIGLFEKWSREKTISYSPLPNSGSNRKYFRIKSFNKSAIGAFNLDKRENKAFIYLTKHFLKKNFAVPKIFVSDLINGIYLLEDLAEITLYTRLLEKRKNNNFPNELLVLFKNVIDDLTQFQINGAKGIDFSMCYPRPAFDRQSMQWDLNYFKYYFLKMVNVPFDEQKLESDFISLINFLLQADTKYFMYRDFNSRNIMLKDEKRYYIDYQGGRKGALQYDIASLIFDSKANIPFDLKEELLDYYIASIQKIKKINKKDFLKFYDGYVLIRLLQMFGAYGYRGYFEGKSHFLQSIPLALNNLKWVLENRRPKLKVIELLRALEAMLSSYELAKLTPSSVNKKKLTVRINSFSYREKIPMDFTGNGGGFVFDCRVIPNPGRLEKYRLQNGKDRMVMQFLDNQPEAQKFLSDAFDIIDQSVQNYLARNWSDLMINYGCTGGQHRSVYCAERTAIHLKEKFDVNVVLEHTKLSQTQINK